MQFVQNFPFFSILLTLMGAVASSVMSGKRARRTTLFLIAADLAFTVGVMIYTLRTGDSYAYKMGHFPAPWGNEIRVGVLETVSLTVFLLVILFSFLGGMRRSEKEIEPTKYNIYCILTDLTMLSLIALVYTNDLFTAYVFIEINTLAAAAFTLGAANLVGVPMLSVFITKVTMAQAAVMTGGRHTVIALCALAISTLLNAYYFLGTTMQLYIPDHEHPERNARVKINVYAAIGLVGFIALNLTLSFCAQGIFGALLDGLTRFA